MPYFSVQIGVGVLVQFDALTAFSALHPACNGDGDELMEVLLAGAKDLCYSQAGARGQFEYVIAVDRLTQALDTDDASTLLVHTPAPAVLTASEQAALDTALIRLGQPVTPAVPFVSVARF